MENLNITKKDLGFEFMGINYEFVEDKQYSKLTEESCHIYTTTCVVYFNTSVSIDGKSFETIEEWIAELYK